MLSESVTNALQNLKHERDRIQSAITTLEGLLGSGGSSTAGAVTGRRRGRPGRPRVGGEPMGGEVARAPGRRRKNAPRGLLLKKIIEVLKGARKPLKPVELRDGVLAAGYPLKNPKTLYTSVFSTAKKSPQVKKTGDGFSLK